MKLNDYKLANWLKEDIHKTLHIHKLVYIMPTDGYYIYNEKKEVNLIDYDISLIFII